MKSALIALTLLVIANAALANTVEVSCTAVFLCGHVLGI